MTIQEIENRFTYHKPVGNQPERYEYIRNLAKALAVAINDLCPESREKSVAFTELETAIMWANASIARNENQILAQVPIPCCERDHNKDGNCDKHPAASPTVSAYDGTAQAELAKKLKAQEAFVMIHEELLKLCYAIEALPAGEQQTKLSLEASNLASNIQKIRNAFGLKDKADEAREKAEHTSRMNRVVAALMTMGINLNAGQLEMLWKELK